MLTNIIYILVFIILVFVLSIAVKAITRGVEAKQIIKEDKNLEEFIKARRETCDRHSKLVCLVRASSWCRQVTS